MTNVEGSQPRAEGSQPSIPPRSTKARVAAGIAALTLVVGGAGAVAYALASQHHAPQPTSSAAGRTGPLARDQTGRTTRRTSATSTTKGAHAQTQKVTGPTLARSDPVSIDIPTISVQSKLQYLGLNATGTIEVPPLTGGPLTNEAAWYDGSPTPGEVGPSIIEGHIDSAATGASVFYNLGELKPGDPIDVTLADGTVAVFSVTGVRQYEKTSFPTAVVYGNTNFAALRLVTCGGTFDYTTGHYLANTVVFAALQSSHAASSSSPGGPASM